MKRYTFFIGPACFAVVLIFFIFLVLCQPDILSDDQQKDYRVMAILKPAGDMYWKNVWQGIQDSVSDASFALSEYEYEFSDAAEEKELLDIAVRTNADGIIFHPKDVMDNEFYEYLSAAKQQGMKIVLVDGSVLSTDYDAFVGINNERAGAAVSEYIADDFATGAEILVLLSEDGLSNALQERLDSFLSAMRGKIPLAEIYTMETSSNISEGIPDIQEFLLENNEIAYLVAFSSTTTLKAAGVISMSDFSERVRVIGFGENAEALQYVENGVIQALFVQDSYRMGEKSVEIMEQLLLGKESVDLENEIGFTLVTPDNVAGYTADSAR